MNFCRIKHSWEYYQEKYDPYDGYIKLKPTTRLAKAWVRKCKRCNKKQEAIIGSGTYNFKLRKYCWWSPCELTKDEIRDFRLRKIGI